jgi:hypothetical protein
MSTSGETEKMPQALLPRRSDPVHRLLSAITIESLSFVSTLMAFVTAPPRMTGRWGWENMRYTTTSTCFCQLTKHDRC